MLTDSYKSSHWKQYPPGTNYVYSYLESRGGKFDETVFFGLQYFLKEYLQGVVVTEELVREAEVFVNQHIGPGVFNTEGWMKIVENGGKLPLKIQALPEGIVVPTKTPLITVENTDPEFFWLVNYMETLLLQVWYPITVATISRECKKLLSKNLKETSNHPTLDSFNSSLNFKLHDFGFRGVSSVESAALGGAAHLVNFMGSDTIPGIQMLREYYHADMPGFSLSASEHSTVTSWGRENEGLAFENMLKQYPEGLVACVSDSYDIKEAVEVLWPRLKDQIMTRNGTLVIRPDSGHINMTLQVVLSSLWKHFGGTVTDDGYKVLDSHVRVIQGDGMNYESLNETLRYIRDIGFSTENVAFGMGGALLQKCDRDTQKFAFKCSAIQVGDEWRDVYKAPSELDENGNKKASFKKSKTGRFSVERTERGIETVQLPLNTGYYFSSTGLLNTVFENGNIVKEHTLEEIRRRANII